MVRLEEWEKRELIEALKKKWQQVNTVYQKTSVTLDTWAKKARKERYIHKFFLDMDIKVASLLSLILANKCMDFCRNFCWVFNEMGIPISSK
jgi:hypothetical protein